MVQSEVCHHGIQSGLQVLAADILVQHVLTTVLKHDVDEMGRHHPVNVRSE